MFGDKADSDSDDSSVQDAEVVQEVHHDIQQAQQLEQHLSVMRAQDVKKHADKKGRRRKSSADSDDDSVVSAGTAVSSATSTAVDSVRNSSSRNDHADEDDEDLSVNDAEAKKREKMRARAAQYQAEYRAKKRLEATGGASSQPRKRGRPRKGSLSPAFSASTVGSGENSRPLTASGKKRGRPRKNSHTPLQWKDSDTLDLEPTTGASSGRDDTMSSSTAVAGASSAGAANQSLLRLFSSAFSQGRKLSNPGNDATVHHLLQQGSFHGSSTGDAYWPNSLQNSPRSASADTSHPSSETKNRGRPKGSKNKPKTDKAGLEKKPRTKKAKLHPVDMPVMVAEDSTLNPAQQPNIEVEKECIA